MIKALLIFLAGAAGSATIIAGLTFTKSVPPSVFASQEAIEAAARVKTEMAPHLVAFMTADTIERRALIDEHFYAPRIAEARRLYSVTEAPLEIDGVYTEVFEPTAGIPARNADKVLINLHGGAFSVGARTEGQLESIPVADVAAMRVISIDYRQGPEHHFPAASEDVATVYRQLLESYQPGQIGIFGCSAGGILAAQAVAWFDTHDLPQPGAIGVFCAGAGNVGIGDSAVIADAFGTNRGAGSEVEYFSNTEWSNPLVGPLNHPGLMSQFPPTLVISSTRDMALSSALATHQQLIANGAESELHIFEGLGHYFFADTGLPESRQVFKLTADFFQRRLSGRDDVEKGVGVPTS